MWPAAQGRRRKFLMPDMPSSEFHRVLSETNAQKIPVPPVLCTFHDTSKSAQDVLAVQIVRSRRFLRSPGIPTLP